MGSGDVGRRGLSPLSSAAPSVPIQRDTVRKPPWRTRPDAARMHPLSKSVVLLYVRGISEMSMRRPPHSER